MTLDMTFDMTRTIKVAATLLAAAIGAPERLAAQNVPQAYGAQTNATLELVDDAAARNALRAIITDAAANGLPTAPLVTKVREGVAKRAPGERIRAATSQLAQRLATAATALAPIRAADEPSAGADALQVGVPASTLTDMRRLWPQKSLTVPLGVLAEMVSSGVSHASASRRVRELLVKGATSSQLAALGTNVRADIAAGLAPDAAMEVRSRGVLSLLYQSASPSAPTITAPAGTPIRPRP